MSAQTTRIEKKKQEMVGRRFGHWVVLSLARETRYEKCYHYDFLCRCDCGTERVVPLGNLRRRLSTSCGCAKNQLISEKNSTHGLSKTAEYRIWAHIWDRCHREEADGWKNYGGRGIAVCEQWRGENGFLNFLADMGERPTSAHTIERKNNNGPYSSDNCRWATQAEQNRNKRNNRWVEFRGERRLLGEWATITGLKEACIRRRLDALGWGVEEALTVSLISGRPRESPRQKGVRDAAEKGMAPEGAMAQGEQ